MGSSTRSLLLHVVDASGRWCNRGFFRALTDRFPLIPFSTAYANSKKNGDLKLGQVHIMTEAHLAYDNIDGSDADTIIRQPLASSLSYPIIVCLLVCLELNGGPMNDDALSSCLVQVAALSSALCASVHLPRIGYGSVGFNWYSLERLIKLHLVEGEHPSSVSVYYF